MNRYKISSWIQEQQYIKVLGNRYEYTYKIM